MRIDEECQPGVDMPCEVIDRAIAKSLAQRRTVTIATNEGYLYNAVCEELKEQTEAVFHGVDFDGEPWTVRVVRY